MNMGDSTTKRVIAALGANGYVTKPGELAATFYRYGDKHHTVEIHKVSFPDPDVYGGVGSGFVYLKPDDYGTLLGEY